MSNDRIMLDETLAQLRSTRASERSESGFLELFAAEQVLKDFDFSADELESGLVGDGGDGGIDAIYLLANGELVQDDTDLSSLRREVPLELILIQAKSSGGFAETPIERFLTFSDDIFDLGKPISTLRGVYNPPLLSAIERFRDTYRTLAARFPVLRIRFIYVSKGDTPDPMVVRKADKVQEAVRSRFSSVDVSFEFIGARELLASARRLPTRTFTLALAENPVSSSGQGGFVCLVHLKDYFAFISDERGHLRRQMFDANVRDYQGSTAVNEEIRSTLAGGGPEDFWWLNNGVSVIATRASLSAKALTIEDPQIVNGLQTSQELYEYFRTANTSGDQRKLLVRVIVPTDGASRDRVIKATNSQTAVQPASLRATDKIHRDIEEYLKPRGLYYDRRKNYYRNEGKPLDSIIGIPHLGQAVMAVVLARPDEARARPSSLLKDDANYARVFTESYPIALYHVVAKVMKRVEMILRSDKLPIPTREVNNLRFYVAMQATYHVLDTWRPNPAVIARLDPDSVSPEVVILALGQVLSAYLALGGKDQIPKGQSLLSQLASEFPPRPKVLPSGPAST